MDQRIRKISRPFRTCSLFLLALVAFAGAGLADVTPNALFGDHAVLQQGVVIPVWGTARRGETVRVSLDGETLTTKADRTGRWEVRFEPRAAGGPHTLEIQGRRDRHAFTNVMIGEVWVCSGQSNMAWSVRRSAKPNTEIAAAAWPNIRLFSVKRTVAGEPQDNVEGSWSECSPETIPNFSAVAYYFGRDIHQMVEVPVGLIHTSWGGTPVEAWTKREALVSTGPLFKDRVDRWMAALDAFPEKNAAYQEKLQAWRVTRDYLRSIGRNPPRRPRAPWGPSHPHRPAGLYNGMIAPLIPYAIRGAIWYQGEGNAGRAYQYRTLFPLMIENWRADWGQGDFPFYFVQLANYREVKDEPASSNWAELREAQSMTLRLPNTGQAVIIDIGEADDIHPKNKQDVGRRLARIALAKTYGRGMTYSGPTYREMTIEEGEVRLRFDHTDPGLVAPGGELKGFAIAGPDSEFVWAKAEIDGDEVVVRHAEVTEPVAVRYGWADNPVCNLYNQAGLPASPFRTDDWPGVTVDRR